MERRDDSHCGTLGWAVLIGGVILWDYFAPETLSGAVDRALEKHRALTIGAIAVTGAHLLNILPEQADPIHLVAERFRHD